MSPFTVKALLHAMKEDERENIVLGLIPKGRIKHSAHMGGRTLCINRYSEHPEEAWDLIRFIMSERVFRTNTAQFSAQTKLLKTIDYGKHYAPSET